MLSSQNMNDKTYEQFRAEALEQIPFYTREWTNYNASDPGITILENFSAFAALQRTQLNEVPEQIKWKLLKLAGFTPACGKPAEEYLYLPGVHDKGITLPKGQKVYAQDICFEVSSEGEMLNAHLLGAYVRKKDSIADYSDLTKEYGVPGGIEIFGEKPVKGAEIFLLIDELPAQEEEIHLYIEVTQEYERNPFVEKNKNPFAAIAWSVLTKQGFWELEARDETCQLMTSGILHLTLPKDREILCRDKDRGMYVIRGRLTRCAYDIAPRISLMRGLLSHAIQIDTKSALMKYKGSRHILLHHFLLKDGYYEVYVKEQDNSYYKYEKCSNQEMPEGGRFYQANRIGRDKMELRFVQHPYGPVEGLEDGVIVVCMEKTVMPHRNLGRLYGYDNQELELPLLKRVYPDSFGIFVVDKSCEGEETYHLMPPDSDNDNDVRYHIMEKENKLVIENCGLYEGADIILAEYAIYQGGDGNILPDSELVMEMEDRRECVYNCPGGQKGRYQESLEEVRRRFVKDITEPVAIVTEQDCEQLIRKIQGLSIHKMKAVPVPEKNLIYIVIKPNSRESCPQLSDIYQNTVMEYLEKHRMLTTRIIVEQPQYVPIDVYGVIYVKKHFKHCREKIEAVLNEKLDGIHSDKGFGESISFYEIYQALEGLDCVDEIYELFLQPGERSLTVMEGADIVCKRNVLCYPGEYRLELSSKQY